jgi:hypothetical protein
LTADRWHFLLSKGIPRKEKGGNTYPANFWLVIRKIGQQAKKLRGSIQEDLGMPKPVYTSKIHSRPASCAAYDEVGDRVRVTEAQLANLRNTSIYPLSGLDMALVEGMRSHSAAPCLTRKQSQLLSAFNSARPRPNSISQCLVCRTV